jgi:hypothetical protein
MPLTDKERSFLLEHLSTSSSRLTQLTRNLSLAQWRFRPDAGSWSIGEVARHVMETEVSVRNNVETLLAGPTAPWDLCEAVRGKETKLLRAVPDRSRRVQMPGDVQPSSIPPAEFLDQFQRVRQTTIDFVAGTNADLDRYVSSHFILKELNAQQWLLLIALHTERHCLQIEEALSHNDLPRE